MRISLVIVALAAIAVTMVHVRREETRIRHAVQRFQIRQIELRRTLYDQQAELGLLTAPLCVQRRVEILDISLTERGAAQEALAETPAPVGGGGRRQ